MKSLHCELPEKNVRTWFSNLSSGSERAAAIAITDVAFIGMFVDVVWKKQDPRDHQHIGTCSNQSTSLARVSDTCGPFQLVTFRELAEIYNYYINLEDVTSSGDSFEELRFEPKVIKKVFQKDIEPDIYKTQNGNDKSKLDSKKIVGIPDLGVSTHNIFHLDKLENGSVNNSERKKLTTNINDIKEQDIIHIPMIPKLQSCTTDPSDKLYKKNYSSKINLMCSSKTESKSSNSRNITTNKKVHSVLVESKNAASRAMLYALPADQFQQDGLLDHIRLTFKSALKFVSAQRMDENRNDQDRFIVVMTLDPEFLEKKSDSEYVLYELAKSVIRREQFRCQSSNNRSDFIISEKCPFLDSELSKYVCKNGGSTIWPKWVETCIHPKDFSVHVLVILLARLELSVIKSHRCYLQSYSSVEKATRVNDVSEDKECSHMFYDRDKSTYEMSTAPCSPSSPAKFTYSKLELSDDFSISDKFFTPPEVEEQEIDEGVDEEVSLSLVSSQKSIADSCSLSNSNAMVVRAPLFQPFVPDNLWDNNILVPFFRNSSYDNERIIRRELDILLNIWTNLQPETDCDYSVASKFQDLCLGSVSKDTISSFQIKDLFLVPFKYLPMTYSVKDTITSESYTNSSVTVQKLSGKWDMFISECLRNVKRTLSSLGLSEHKSSTTTGSEIKNQWDHASFTINNGNRLSKILNEQQKILPAKKKKKKKKKRKATPSSNSSAGITINHHDFSLGKDSNECIVSPQKIYSVVKNVYCQSIIPESHSTQQLNNEEESIIGGTFLKVNVTKPGLNSVIGSCVIGSSRLQDEEDSDTWETVEPKGTRNNKNKKKSNSCNIIRPMSGSHSCHNAQNRSKGRTRIPRQRLANRNTTKDAKDVFFSILDSVDGDANRNGKGLVKSNPNEKRKINEEWMTQDKLGQTTNSVSPDESCLISHNKRASTLRDVVIGNEINDSILGSNFLQSKPVICCSIRKSDRTNDIPNGLPYKNNIPMHMLNNNSNIETRNCIDCTNENNFNLNAQKTVTSSMDQSTVPTLPETLSAVSAVTESTSTVDDIAQKKIAPNTVNESLVKSRKYILNVAEQQTINGDSKNSYTSSEGEVDPSPMAINSCCNNVAPPLRTLLGPGNTNSASSSVASSLEAPHATRHHNHHSDTLNKEGDVGYHLLTVCERLSDDMNTFMRRRALALEVRRRERGMLLASLQDTLQTIWACRCRVEMYGSCATQLDLPSSDLDVVVYGLDNEHEVVNSSQPNTKSYVNIGGREDDKNIIASVQHNNQLTQSSQNDVFLNKQQPHQCYSPISTNGYRVIRLSTELEQQSWVVQVKAIPTASVPVIKILADPSRLPGAISGADWFIHQQHMVVAASQGMIPSHAMSVRTDPKQYRFPTSSCQSKFVVAGDVSPTITIGHHGAIVGVPSHRSSHYNTSPPPWRGADVMNGLLSVDITFEGPEHGGIGSTAFSAGVVQEACNETGLPPECTPAVQVIIVIKELLAQRRLNEPFSGGLSSYAILLLVVAVIKERRAIRAEMDRAERQRMAVVSGNAGTSSNNTSKSNKDSNILHEPAELAVNSSYFDENPSPRTAWKNNPSNKYLESYPSSNVKLVSSQITLENPISTGRKLSSNVLVKECKRTNTKSLLKPAESKSSWASIAKKVSTVQHNTTDKLQNHSIQTSREPNSFSTLDSTNSLFSGDKEGMTSTKTTVDSDNGVGSDDTNGVSCPLFPQGSNDVLEVLCSGEPTPGKLLMHFLLFYGQHFDAQSFCIDVRGTHHPEYKKHRQKHFHLSPFISRKSGGSYDPITGVFTVDPILVYDPLEGAESNNVAKSCFAWNSIRWVFEQCFNTLSGVVECGAGATWDKVLNATDTTTNIADKTSGNISSEFYRQKCSSVLPKLSDQLHHIDSVSPLLELLLSF